MLRCKARHTCCKTNPAVGIDVLQQCLVQVNKAIKAYDSALFPSGSTPIQILKPQPSP